MSDYSEFCDGIDKAIGREINTARKARGLTAVELASRLRSTPNPQTLRTWEYGTRACPLAALVDICDVLGMNISELMARAFPWDADVSADPWRYRAGYGQHSTRNIYRLPLAARGGLGEQIGVMFTEEDGELVADALNASLPATHAHRPG